MMEGFHKYKKIYRLGHDENAEIFSDPEDEIVIQEKIDGGNFRFAILNGKVIIGSRTQQLTDDEGNDSNMNKMFIRCANYVREQIKDKDLSKYEGLLFYGENCVKHTISYDWEEIPPFLGFDILDLTTGKFYGYGDVQLVYGFLNLPMVPHFRTCKVKDLPQIDDDLVPISKYARDSAPDRKAEGLVFKNYRKQIMAKYVRDAFKEKNAEAFGGTPKYNKVDETQNADFLFKFCTNARIEKAIFKRLEQGDSLDLKLMQHVPKDVWTDIWNEEWQYIANQRWMLDFGGIKKLIPKRCKAVIQQMMVNNALQ